MAATSPATDPRALLSAKRWVVRPQRIPDARIRVFCFPHAGAGAAAFTPWAGRLPAGAELCAIRFPGRENRIDEAPFDDLQLLVDALEPAVAALSDRPFVLLGHCSGSVIALELAHRLRDRHGKRPEALVVSSIAGPVRRSSESIHLLPREEFFERVALYGGIDESVLGDPEIMDVFEPTLRADFRIAEEGTTEHTERLDVPIVAVGGRHDPFVGFEDLSAWGEETSTSFSVHHLDAGHFVLNETMERLVAALPAHLRQAGVEERPPRPAL
ncbi:thioesterase II family protein [Streptomyces bobili]|jgi:medium-chain acyl-[acyl-carrier-protein] hydrolase|uniref:thioesterase II family protein n=1 Tax=Streptomyces bobili TaxID=67280 RepID=UPI000A3D2AA4|nr:alpha/beta fold hydrolase [Streptomyces bobili]